MKDRAPPTRRLAVIDAARGLAVLGVGLCNAPGVIAPPGMAGHVHAFATQGDRWLWVAGQVMWQGRLVALLSLLFGASMVWIAGDGSDPERNGRLDRRLGWLALIGVLHGALIWWGDILLPYALAGLALRMWRGWSARRLLVAGGIAYALGVIVLRVDAAVALLQHGGALAQLETGRGDLAPGMAAAALRNLRLWLAVLPQSLAAALLTSAPMMMIGMGMARTRRLSRAWLRRHAAWLLALGLAAGLIALPLALMRAGIWPAPPGMPPSVLRFWAVLLRLATAPAGALGWLGLASLLDRGQVYLAAVGRLALSTYLMQSLVVCAGLILIPNRFETLSYGGLMGCTAALLCLQLLLAQVLRRLGRRGPAEMLWRALYLRWGRLRAA